MSQVEIFHKAVLRSGLNFVFSSGFNPLPRLEFASAMTLGIPSFEETASCLLYENMETSEFILKMNKVLPSNLQITEAFIFPVTNMRKRESLSQGLWGGIYRYSFYLPAKAFFESEQCKEFLEKNSAAKIESIGEDKYQAILPVSDKNFRMAIESFYEKKWYEIVCVEKLHTLAKNEINGWTAEDEEMWRKDNKNFVKSASCKSEQAPVSFIELYSQIAKINIDLINKRKELQIEQEEFLKSHPDFFRGKV